MTDRIFGRSTGDSDIIYPNFRHAYQARIVLIPTITTAPVPVVSPRAPVVWPPNGREKHAWSDGVYGWSGDRPGCSDRGRHPFFPDVNELNRSFIRIVLGEVGRGSASTERGY